MATIEVSFRPLSRGRYRPQVWRGEYKLDPRNGKPTTVRVFELKPAIPQSQLNAFRNRFAPRRPMVKKPKTHAPQRPTWMQGRTLFSNAYEAVVCQGCRQQINVPYDAKKVTCGKCGDITPIKRDYL